MEQRPEGSIAATVVVAVKEFGLSIDGDDLSKDCCLLSRCLVSTEKRSFQVVWKKALSAIRYRCQLSLIEK